ncbi:aspartate/glutamate racemase family protein [Pseudorhodoferax sp. Leaf274]|uniref:aspartate/glutamate racemase family protein n=1 Tax=Pseudorhodoferax sp. Leaf274 TaxID=1736318 RepID=UPI0007038D1A|nr:aspartate/glutamate racemase family protein [Pseudorhodoferax sp. Leaf274]KQP49510.1 Asp/Glu racemase [Pseudorhodoferax sp. Leaf274]
MRQLLVVNPNTSATVTALLQQHVQREAGAGVQVHSITARLGAPYIACEASYAVAAHAALDAWAAALAEPGRPTPDAVLIGCFGDPGLFALREASPAPVTGLAEAAFAEAAQHGRFAVVTGGARWVPMLERLALALGHQALAGIHTVAPTGAQLMADPEGSRALLARACQEAAARWDAQAVIVGGAGLAGVAAAIQGRVGVPLIDSVGAGTRMALRLQPAPGARARPGFDVAWQQVGAELAALGR